MKSLFISCLFILFGFTQVFSQQVILRDFLSVNTEKPAKGPNSSYYSHFYGSWGINVKMQKPETDIRPLSSYRYSLGHRHIIRLNNHIATGFNLELSANRFSIKQKEGKNVHDSILHDKEIFLINSIEGSWYLRFNFDKRRGAYIGHFLDLGAFGGYNYKRNRFIQNTTTPFNSVTKLTYRKIGYINDFQYGLFARIGFNRYVLFGRYRMSDIFETEKGFSQLPAWCLGIEVGFHK